MQGGKRMAVLAGCNYPGWGCNALKGCINDAVSMKEVLTSKFGFKEEDIELLTDEPTSKNKSTGANIKNALERMANNAADGDLLVFYFSGHGTLIDDSVDPSKKHEAIIPCDSRNYHDYITDMYFRKLVRGIGHKAFFTMLSDSCHSGGLIGEEKEQIGPSSTPPSKAKTNYCYRRKFVPMESILAEFNQGQRCSTLNMGDFVNRYFRDVDASLSIDPPCERFNFGFHIRRAYNNGILLSGCQSNEYCIDDESINPPHGTFTYAVMTLLGKSGCISNRDLILQTRKFLEDQLKIDSQHPCLYCIDENVDATFLLQRQATTN